MVPGQKEQWKNFWIIMIILNKGIHTLAKEATFAITRSHGSCLQISRRDAEG